MIDAAFLGASFLTGSVLGGAIGGALGYFSSDKLADVKLLHQPLGGMRLRYGPTRNLQFPFVLLNRALLHHRLVEERTHAQRGVLKIGYEIGHPKRTSLPEGSTREFSRLFSRLQRSEPGTTSRAAALVDLTQAIGRVMQTGAGDSAWSSRPV
jgi:hypothetical protein